MTDNQPKTVNNFGHMEVPSRLEQHNDVGIRECYKGHVPVEVDLSLGRNRHYFFKPWKGDKLQAQYLR